MELRKIELAIEAIEGGVNVGGPSLRRAGSHVSPSREKLAEKEDFDRNDKVDLKIAYALTKLKEADKMQIVGEIMEQEPDQDSHKLEGNVAVRLSHLLKNGMIMARRSGRSYIYSLF